MKKLLIPLLVLLLAANAFAVRKQTLLDNKTHLGWYVAPVVKLGEVDDDLRAFGGVRGGLIIDHTFYVGGAVFGLANDEDDWDCYCCCEPWDVMEIAYGGLELGLISQSHKLTHMSMGVLIGGGAVDDNLDPVLGYDEFFVMEPNLDLLINVSRHVTLGFGAGYRFVDDLKHPLLDDDDLSGPVFNLSLKIGSF